MEMADRSPRGRTSARITLTATACEESARIGLGLTQRMTTKWNAGKGGTWNFRSSGRSSSVPWHFRSRSARRPGRISDAASMRPVPIPDGRGQFAGSQSCAPCATKTCRVWPSCLGMPRSGLAIPARMRGGWHGQGRGGRDHRPNRQRHLLPKPGDRPVGSRGHPGPGDPRTGWGKPTMRCGTPGTTLVGGCMMTGAAR